MEYTIKNKTFDEINVGDSASIENILTERDILLFALMSGDVNPAHLDPDYAKDDMFHTIIGHGMWGGSLISTVLGTQLPGPGTIYLSQSLKFLKPVLIGDLIKTKIIVIDKNPENYHMTFDCACTNQNGKDVITGIAIVLAPTEKVKRKRIQIPNIEKALGVPSS